MNVLGLEINFINVIYGQVFCKILETLSFFVVALSARYEQQ